MPSSGRWMALFAGGFRRLRAASDFARGGKVTKTPPGDAADGHFVPIGPLTPGPPFTGVTPWGGQNISGAQNQECLSAVPSGPAGGLSGKKIGTAAVPLLRLGLPNQRSRFASCVGATLAVARKPSPLGEGAERSEADEGNGPDYESGPFQL